MKWMGGIMSPADAAELSKGIKTLNVGMEAQRNYQRLRSSIFAKFFHATFNTFWVSCSTNFSTV